MDILDLFLQAFNQQRFFIVVIDYFTKWVEDKLLAHNTKSKVKSF